MLTRNEGPVNINVTDTDFMNSSLTNHLFVVFTYETLLLDCVLLLYYWKQCEDNKVVSFRKKIVISYPHLSIHFCWQCLPHITRSHQDSLFQLLGYLSEVRIVFLHCNDHDSAFAENVKISRLSQFTNKNICFSISSSILLNDSFWLLSWTYYHSTDCFWI